ncbi:hypothetical protein EVAR_13970_1 [Eumeta japonica]|uniref:Uncharacterized protein n=1 Tax=Eumeta variegata TaxID=151549 RepID=A0A4C1U8P2_EUMVA|nr:hypothetical protein EVAR_13970_1 [Eumeta japonica]
MAHILRLGEEFKPSAVQGYHRTSQSGIRLISIRLRTLYKFDVSNLSMLSFTLFKIEASRSSRQVPILATSRAELRQDSDTRVNVMFRNVRFIVNIFVRSPRVRWSLNFPFLYIQSIASCSTEQPLYDKYGSFKTADLTDVRSEKLGRRCRRRRAGIVLRASVLYAASGPGGRERRAVIDGGGAGGARTAGARPSAPAAGRGRSRGTRPARAIRARRRAQSALPAHVRNAFPRTPFLHIVVVVDGDGARSRDSPGAGGRGVDVAEMPAGGRRPRPASRPVTHVPLCCRCSTALDGRPTFATTVAHPPTADLRTEGFVHPLNNYFRLTSYTVPAYACGFGPRVHRSHAPEEKP